jgi:BON domain
MSKKKNSRRRGRERGAKLADAPLNGPDVPFEDKQRELEGRRPADQQGEAVIMVEETDDLGAITASDIYQGELEAGVNDDLPNDRDDLELLIERELRDGETDNPFEAVEEGLTYVPPSDPPTVPSGDGDLSGAVVASGMASSALDAPYDEDHHQSFYPGGDELSARVREALRADSSSSEYADKVRIITRGAVVILRGEVVDLEDSDNLSAVAAFVEGVEEVVDELRVRALE